MRILTWNIQNSGTIEFNNPQKENIANILSEVEKIKADVVVFQEFQLEYGSELVENGLKRMDYECTVCTDEQDKTLRNRVLIAVKSKYLFDDCEYPPKIRKYSRRNWREIFIKNKNIVILGVDVPLAETSASDGRKRDNRKEKKEFLEAMKVKFEEYSKYNIPALVIGDFNLHEYAVFKEYLSIFDDLLTNVTTKEPTWGKYKLDYIYVNSEMKKLIHKSKAFSPYETVYSDHKYLYVDIED